MRPPKDYTGQTFNSLTAIRYTQTITVCRRSIRLWLFRCVCGNEIERRPACVIRDNKSCGCQDHRKRKDSESIAWHVFRHYDDGDLSFEDFKKQSQLLCHYCNEWSPNVRKQRGRPHITYAYHGLDRLDSSQPHNLNNVVPCCWSCNNMKSNHHINDYLGRIGKIYRNHKTTIKELAGAASLSINDIIQLMNGSSLGLNAEQ